MIKIRSLAGIDYDVMAEAFNDAFSDYAVPAKYSVEYLRDLVLRRGYRPDLAVGAFDGGRLVGFVFNCLDGDAAYNSGTGTAISHRRRGIARQLMQRSIETLPAKRYILEVIETNERAAALYRDLGFAETRRLQCWTYDGAPGSERSTLHPHPVSTSSAPGATSPRPGRTRSPRSAARTSPTPSSATSAAPRWSSPRTATSRCSP